jgi:hypothetical protein
VPTWAVALGDGQERSRGGVPGIHIRRECTSRWTLSPDGSGADQRCRSMG